MEQFYCPKCQKVFEAEGKKIEWEDPIYGHCSKAVAKCPICGTECDEYRPNISSKKKDFLPPTCGCGSFGL